VTLPNLTFAATGARLGSHVALSADGTQAFIFGLHISGAWRVTWSEEEGWAAFPQLLPNNPAYAPSTPRTAAISSDGSVLLLGSASISDSGAANTGVAAAWSPSGNVLSPWQQLGADIVPTGAAEGDLHGAALSLSADGRTALIGAPRDDLDSRSDAGSARVFDWDGTAWVQRGGLLREGLASGSPASDSFGAAVALSADGATAVVGGPNNDTFQALNVGGALVLDWNGSAWVQRGATLIPADGTNQDRFGQAAEISANRNAVLLGGPGDDVGNQTDQGSARLFDWSGSAWVQRGGAITPADGRAGDAAGSALDMTPDALTVVIGLPGDDVNDAVDQGSARVLDWNGNAWVQRGGAMTPGDGASGDAFGTSVSISDDGRIVLVGGPGDDVDGAVNRGSARIFWWSGAAWVEGGPVTGSIISLETPTLALAEGQDGTTGFSFTVTRSGDVAGTASAAWSVAGLGADAADAADFGGSLPGGTVTFAAGETSRTITVAVTADRFQERDETFLLTLSAPSEGASLGQGTATGTILQDDFFFTIAGGRVLAEGNEGGTQVTFTVTRQGASGAAASVGWQVRPSNINPVDGADFPGGVLPSGRVEFAAGETSRTFVVTIAGDVTPEPQERFFVGLTDPQGGGTLGVPAFAEVWVQPDDPGLLNGTEGADLIQGIGESHVGPAGATVLFFATDGADSLAGLGSGDVVQAGAGHDSLSGGDGADTLFGGNGRDTLSGDEGADLLFGGQPFEADSLSGGAGADTLVSRAGDDTLAGEAGADSLDGGQGFGEKALSGGEGNDTLAGGDGNDTLDGGTGADSLAGGAGGDRVLVDDLGDRILELTNGGADTVVASVDWVLGRDLEDLVLAGDARSGTGNATANRITGNAAANILSGGAGADTLAGGAGNDLYRADRGDVVIEADGEGQDTVAASWTFSLAGTAVEALTLTGTARLDGTGNELNNLLAGNAEANRLMGEGGDDSLNGGAGEDTLRGGGGADTLLGGDGIDRLEGGAGNDAYIVADGDLVVEAADAGIDLVMASVSVTLVNNVENLTLTSNTAIDGTGNTLANVIRGNGGANLLQGMAGDDSLDGGNGNDTLVGGAGADTLSGGFGNDSFRFAVPREGGDVIADYRVAADTIEIAAGFAAGLTAGMNLVTAGLYAANAAGTATGAFGQFVFDTDDLLLFWDADGTGAGARQLIAALPGVVGFVGTEIVVIA
jgi:Ca2+-binding RTX toxin-like protein